MEEVSTGRKKFVTRTISWETSKFRNFKKQDDLRLLSIHLRDPRINSLTENMKHCLTKMFLKTWQKIAG